MKDHLKVSEFLGEARDEIANHYTRGQMRNDNGDGEVCSRGAIRRVAARHLDQLDVAYRADAALLAAVREVSGFADSSIERAHDHSDQEYMLNIFDKAICGLEEIGQ
jgi:hypothetical protein